MERQQTGETDSKPLFAEVVIPCPGCNGLGLIDKTDDQAEPTGSDFWVCERCNGSGDLA